ncbi:MAG: tetratricopeptide repeat protein [Candidatus Binatia bacterium]
MKCFPRGEVATSLKTVGELILVLCLLAGCSSEALERQAEQLRQQQIQLDRQRQEIDDLLAKQKARDQRSRDCNRAFREYFEKAQTSSDPERAIAFYRQGLAICPDDDVAHYELGKVLVDAGRTAEAERAFEAALKINPDFVDAKRRLDALRKNF